MKKILIALTIGAFSLASAPAMSEGPSNYYAVVFLGQSDLDVDEDFGSAKLDDTDTYFALGGGYIFSDNLAVEVSYNDFGEFSASLNGAKASASGTSIAASAIGRLPIDGAISLLGRLGLDIWDGEVKITGAGALNGSADDDGTDIFFGVGGAYELTKKASISLEYQMHEFDVEGTDIEANVLTLGLAYKL